MIRESGVTILSDMFKMPNATTASDVAVVLDHSAELKLSTFVTVLQLLKPELRREYLTRLTDFLNTDNNRNWRFREDLAEYV